MLLLIDNYDSFSYNLVQLFSALGADVIVKRNDEVDVEQIVKLNPSHLVISPGPGSPDDAGVSLELVRRLSGVFPILGVCLGHQTIAQAFGGKIIHAKKIMHGKISSIEHNGADLFSGVANPLCVARYHSLIADMASLPACLHVTAHSFDDSYKGKVLNDEKCVNSNEIQRDKIIMGLKHKVHPTYGVQFHPESIATEIGEMMLHNFLKL